MNYTRQGRRDIKLAFQDDARVKRVAEQDGMIRYGEKVLRDHYFNTGRTILQLVEYSAKKGYERF